jgi:hypothetical protein
MELIIEMETSELLDEFRQFAYDEEKELVIFEQYDHTPGFNKEPVVVAVIVSLGGPAVLSQLTKIIQSFLNYYLEKHKTEIKANLKQEKQRLDFLKEIFKLKIKNAKGVKKLNAEDFINCSFEDLMKMLDK